MATESATGPGEKIAEGKLACPRSVGKDFDKNGNWIILEQTMRSSGFYYQIANVVLQGLNIIGVGSRKRRKGCRHSISAQPQPPRSDARIHTAHRPPLLRSIMMLINCSFSSQ